MNRSGEEEEGHRFILGTCKNTTLDLTSCAIHR